MAFRVSDRDLERLEWPALVALLAAQLRSAAARSRMAALSASGRELLLADPSAVHEALAETAEARALLEETGEPPLGGGADLAQVLGLLRRGGLLSPAELLELAATLRAMRETGRMLAACAERTPALAARAAALADLHDLETRIGSCIDADTQVRDDASPALRRARRDARAIQAELTRRAEALLRDGDVAAALSDAFTTLRNDRVVLPVRADARRRVPGIVHDASASGNTLFIEPESLVDANNRLRQAQLDAERETRRVLRGLSSDAAAVRPALERSLDAFTALDHAFARGRLASGMRAAAPEVGDAGVLRLPQLRHPLIADDEVVPNDVRLGEGFHVLVLSGPNAGGKTVTLKALALSALMVRAGLQVPAAPGARVDLVDAVLVDIGDAQDLRAHLSTFSAHLASLVRILESATSRSLVVIDEIGVGTDPAEGAALAQAALEALADVGARVVTTTHHHQLKECAARDPRFENACVEFDPRTLAPTYRLRFGSPGPSSAATLAERMGLRRDVVTRARELAAGGQQDLDRLLEELARSRAELDRERGELVRLRAQAEAARREAAERLHELRKRRQDMLRGERRALRDELRRAQAQVAAVIRDLQRGDTAQAAADARERLAALEAEAERLDPRDEPTPADADRAIDWSRVQPGLPVRLAGGEPGSLVSLPDRRGRVTVQLGASRVVVPAQRVFARPADASAPPRARVPLPAAPDPDGPASSTGECDLRGLRVDEALAEVDAALDRALASGCERVRLIHGHGTGSLRAAVREHLARVAHVRSFGPGGAAEGGEGVTVARLA